MSRQTPLLSAFGFFPFACQTSLNETSNAIPSTQSASRDLRDLFCACVYVRMYVCVCVCVCVCEGEREIE